MEKFSFEINYEFKVCNNDLNFKEIRDLIIKQLKEYEPYHERDERREFREKSFYSPIQNHLENRFKSITKKRIPFSQIQEDVKLISYEEEQRSLIIKFTIFFICTLIAYGSIRQSIDYIINDFKNICRSGTNKVKVKQRVDKSHVKTNWTERLFERSGIYRLTFIFFIVYISAAMAIFITKYELNDYRGPERVEIDYYQFEKIMDELEKVRKIEEIERKLQTLNNIEIKIDSIITQNNLQLTRNIRKPGGIGK